MASRDGTASKHSCIIRIWPREIIIMHWHTTTYIISTDDSLKCSHWRQIVWPDFYKPAESDHNCKHQCIIDFQFRSVLITSAMKMLKTNELEKCHFNTEKALILLTLQLKSWKCKIMISLLRYAFALWSCCSHNTSHIACLSLRRKCKLLKIWINRSGSCGEWRCAAAW